jgi:pyruvate/2-oxoglutarate/acetoin dehydrogenase E1 component
MRKTTYIQAINEAIKEEMRRDESVFLIGEDVGHYGGLFRVTRNLMDEFGTQRVIDTPISEQGFTGMAIGAAIVGMRPIMELMYMDFFLVCADQILNQAAKMHYMTGDGWAVESPDGDSRPTGRWQGIWLTTQPMCGKQLCSISWYQGSLPGDSL